MDDRRAIVVTGAGGNLGAAVALELAQGDARLVCMDRSADKLGRLAAQLPAAVEVMTIAGTDMTDARACAAAIAEAKERFGAIGALANTVGGFEFGPLAKAVDQWDRMMAMNARTALSISAAVMPVMKAARYGRIVHVAAGAGLKAPAGLAAYAASKAAVIRLTESIAEEGRADNITANCILPSIIDTPQNRADMPDAKKDDWVSPQSIARLIAFLVSPASAAVTGAAIPATGAGR